MKYMYKPKTRKALIKAIGAEIERQGYLADLNCIDTSAITNMQLLFAIESYDEIPYAAHEFDGDISNWDVSSVTEMGGMFRESSFNGDVSRWNVSNVTDMFEMFSGSSFNGDVSKWKVGKETITKDMFLQSNCPVPDWYKDI